MLGLANYSSSDEDDADSKSLAKSPQQTLEDSDTIDEKSQRATTNATQGPQAAADDRARTPQVLANNGASEDVAIGPMVGPAGPSASPHPSTNGSTSRPQSPYSAGRALLRDLTLPQVPNLDIPPSPPGSPPADTNAKFANFIQLKRQGVHFNEKLARSSALKNPSLLQKLMSFAGIDERGQYATTLPEELWDPNGFPPWAYKEELAQSQQDVTKRKEEEKARIQRESIEFVPSVASGDSSRSGTPGLGSTARGLGRSAAERVMAGLDQGKTQSLTVVDVGKRREVDRRGGRYDEYRSRDRSG
ncbi:MAG: hypothetical protein M1825_000300 [Sarcosagium campestre]|nr:MAG: hypothetical protein M1825_000300 [Sarcosagium campestre]